MKKNLHLQIVSELARLFSDSTMIDRVLECSSPAEVLELFGAHRRELKAFERLCPVFPD